MLCFVGKLYFPFHGQAEDFNRNTAENVQRFSERWKWPDAQPTAGEWWLPSHRGRGRWEHVRGHTSKLEWPLKDPTEPVRCGCQLINNIDLESNV